MALKVISHNRLKVWDHEEFARIIWYDTRIHNMFYVKHSFELDTHIPSSYTVLNNKEMNNINSKIGARAKLRCLRRYFPQATHISPELIKVLSKYSISPVENELSDIIDFNDEDEKYDILKDSCKQDSSNCEDENGYKAQIIMAYLTTFDKLPDEYNTVEQFKTAKNYINTNNLTKWKSIKNRVNSLLFSFLANIDIM